MVILVAVLVVIARLIRCLRRSSNPNNQPNNQVVFSVNNNNNDGSILDYNQALSCSTEIKKDNNYSKYLTFEENK